MDEKMKQLKSEIGLRENFCVLGIEATDNDPIEMSHELKCNLLRWYSGYGFKFWVSRTLSLSEVSDVRPFMHTVLGSDMLEIATAPSVVNMRKRAERFYLKLPDTKKKLPIKISHWEYIFRYLEVPQEFKDEIQPFCNEVPEYLYSTTFYEKKDFPQPHLKSECKGALDFKVEVKASADGSKMKTRGMQTKQQNSAIALNYFGKRTALPHNEEELSGLVRNVLGALRRKKLLASARYNNDLGSDPNEFSANFKNLLSLLDGITSSPTLACKWVLQLFPKDECEDLLSALKGLFYDLKSDQVSVWFGAKVAFIPKTKEPAKYLPFWAITEEDSKGLIIYLSDDHPSFEEAVIHAYLKHSYSWTTGSCVMAEALVK
jgi:hypothetical protein